MDFKILDRVGYDYDYNEFSKILDTIYENASPDERDNNWVDFDITFFSCMKGVIWQLNNNIIENGILIVKVFQRVNENTFNLETIPFPFKRNEEKITASVL